MQESYPGLFGVQHAWNPTPRNAAKACNLAGLPRSSEIIAANPPLNFNKLPLTSIVDR
jgi:hypothetical protein